MAIPSSLLIHTCTIVHQEEGPPDPVYGVPTVVETTQTDVKCRFFPPSTQTRQLDLDSGNYLQTLPIVMFPSTVEIYERDKITGDNDGFEKTYDVKNVAVVYAATRVSHLECELEVTS